MIEILVVLLIISIVTVAAVVTLGYADRPRQMGMLAERLQIMLATAQQQAILTNNVLGMTIQSRQYGFVQLQLSPDDLHALVKPHYSSLHSMVLPTQQSVPTGISLQLLMPVDGENKPSNKPIWVLPNGGFLPFTLRISASSTHTIYQLTGDMAGNLVLVRADKS